VRVESLLTPEHREVARLLLQKAREDFSAAQVLIATADQTDHVIGFHLQQTVEKALKSVLASYAIEIPRIHDLGYLVELLSDIDLKMPEKVASSDWLTPWGVLFRYDDDPNDSLDRNKTLDASAAAIAFAEAA
jgi:HEPN domain-containing protein